MPQSEALDRERWTALWSRLGARGDGLSTLNQLAAAYAEPTRAYHNAEHIGDCLAQLDLSRSVGQHLDEVEAALWFHDAVYLPGSADNEARSAHMVRASLAGSGVPARAADRIAGLVLATSHLRIPTEPDAALLCDIDLSILGRSQEIFSRFEQQIRREYSSVPEISYRSARSEILRSFLRRPCIYQTGFFHDRYEARARTNLTRVLGELGG